MFDTLDEQSITMEGIRPTAQRLVRFLWVALVALLLFGGLYLGIVSLD
jgi:preprotein translocase subunit SecY